MDGFRSSLCRWLERPDWVSCCQVSEAKFQVAHFIGLEVYDGRLYQLQEQQISSYMMVQPYDGLQETGLVGFAFKIATSWIPRP